MKFLTISSMVFMAVCLRADDSTQSGVRLLDLNVVAVDNHGKPVTDLTADDFQIVDAGKPQKITFFRRNDDSSRQNPAPASGPNQFSNRAKGGSPNATVILFDMLNMGFGARGFAADQIVRALGGMDSADSLYLYMLSVDGKLFAVHGITPGEGAAPEPPGAPWTRRIKPLMDEALQTLTRFRSPDIDVFVRIPMTFSALNTLGGQLSAIPGRKVVVWVTDGVPVALGEMRSDTGLPIDYTPQIRQLSGALERSNIALYPVRQIMLGRSDNIGAESGGNGATGGAGTGLQSIATLELFADLTGGRRNADKDISAAVHQAMADLHFSYQIGYSVPSSNWDDKFHKLSVTSKRKGLRIQAKRGYYAWKSAAGSRTQQAFNATAATPFDAEEIGLRATVSADPQNHAGEQVDLRIDARDIALSQDGDRYTGHLGIMAVGYLPSGLIDSSPAIALDLHYTAAERDQVLRDGIAFTRTLTPSQGENKFRVMVFDRSSNSVGSITIPAAPPQQAQH